MTDNQRQEPKLPVGRHSEEELQALSDRELDAVVAAVLGLPAVADPAYTSWAGFGLIVEHLRERGYTVQCYLFEAAHLEWLNHCEQVNGRPGDRYRRAEVSVIDRHNRLWLVSSKLTVTARDDTLPRAAAIAAIIASQREYPLLDVVNTLSDSSTHGTWNEDRRRRHSERMKRYWERRKAGTAGEPHQPEA